MKWDDVAFIQGRARMACLQELAKGPNTPTHVAASIEEPLSHVSRALRELQDRSLVQNLTPKLRKNKIYGITESGKKALSAARLMRDGG